MKKLTPGLAASAALLLLVVAVSNLTGAGTPVIATHAPANKVAASGDSITPVPPAGTTTGVGSDANNIMTATLRTSSPTDLVLAVTLECSLITTVVVPGTTAQGATSSGNAEGQIRIWIVVDDTYIVPIMDGTGTVKGHAIGTDSDKVTFCNREHRVTVTDTEDAKDGIDRQQHYLRTKDANAFNWVALNLGSGIHQIDVRADFTSTYDTTGSSSSGLVGNRSLVVTPAKLANDATI